MIIAPRRQARNHTTGSMGLLMATLFLALVWFRPVWAQQGSTAANTVTDIKTTGSGDSVEISISTTRRPDSSVFTLSSPARLVVDIADASPGRFTAPIAVNRGPVKEIVAKEFREAEGVITRVTVYLDSVVEPISEVQDTGIRIQLKPRAATASAGSEDDDAIGAAIAGMDGNDSERQEVASMSGSGSVRKEPADSTKVNPDSVPEASGVNQVTGLYFQPYEKRSRVLIKSSGRLHYSASPVSQDQQVVIDIPNATLPKTFQRPLDTSEFPSAVKMVSAYPLKNKDNTVRVVIKLRENVAYNVEDRGNQVYFDFPIPSGVAGRLPGNPVGEPMLGAPMGRSGEDPGDATRASDDEMMVARADQPKLISSSGQIVDTRSQKSSDSSSDSMMGVMGDSNAGMIYNGRKISIDVREADLHNVFRMIANVSKLNIVTSDNVVGKVTVRLQNVPWDQALAVILQSKGLGAVRFGNIIRIAPLSVLKAEREQQLEAVKASQNLESLQTLVLPLNFANVAEIRPQVEAALSDRGKLTLDTRTNALIIEDTPAGIAKARQLASSLDTQTPQVLIEARVVELSSTSVREIGIQWGGYSMNNSRYGNATGLVFPNSVNFAGGTTTEGGRSNLASNTNTAQNWVVDVPAASAGTLSLNLGSIRGNFNLDARLSAIESSGQGRVISAPKVLTVDNKQAGMKSGTKIPYETVSAAGTSVQFIEATLNLEVTPHITTDNRVFLKVKVNNNRPDFGNAVNGQPAIEVKEASTEVMVRDGDTTVIGGVYSLNESNTVEGLPGLMKIPFLGWAFKSDRSRTERKELLVFITPHVLARKGQNDG